MSETTPATATADPANIPEPQGDPADLGDAGKKALDAERRRATTAEKQAKALQAQLDEIKSANLSDLEKAQKAATDAALKLAEYEKTTLRQKVALDKGLPAKWVGRLAGETEEELAADADAILADLGNAPKATPKPDPSQGARDGQGTRTNADLFAAAVEGQFTR